MKWVVASGPVLALVSVLLTVAALETVCRVANVDFEFKAHAFNTVPIFYRQPVVPVGPAFFRRPGPDRWDGQVLRQMYRMAGGQDGAYGDEPRVSIRYDSQGFRNLDDLRDWDVVVVGDSFTELGFLPEEELFTTRLGELLGVRVKNLGVSYTGTFTHVAYLATYGRAPSTRDAVLVFFEGNDFADIADEDSRMRAANAGQKGKAPFAFPSRLVTLPRQNSFLTAAYRLITGRRPVDPVGSHPLVKNAGSFNAYFVWNGSRTPVSIEQMMPPSAADFSPFQRSLAIRAIGAWGAIARTLGLRPWLVFMPTKRRVMDGYLAWKPGERRTPLPGGIPELLEEIATASGVRFIDATPALRRETEAGRLPYNGIWDTHLNGLGSSTVARVLAEALGPEWPRS